MRSALAVVLLLGLLGSAARAAEELKLPPVTRATLDNGLRVLVAEYHELPLVEFYLIVGAGAGQDPAGKEGLAALTANGLRRGAGTLSAEAFAKAVESLGGQIGAAAGTDGTIISGEFLSGDFATGLDLLRQVVTAPTFAKDEVRRARDEQLAGITAAREQAAQVAEKCYVAFLFGSHPYGRPVDGRRASVAKLDRGDVRGFYDHWYHPNDTILVLVGDVTADDAVARLRTAFGAWKPSLEALAPRTPPPAPVAARKLLLVDKPDATQTQIRFGNISIARNDPDYVPAQVANTILGGGFTSQLIEELRVKRSLTYSAYSMFAARLTGGDFRVSTFTKTPTTVETLDLALAVEGAFRTQPPPAKMLVKARTFLMGQFPLKLETPEALAAKLAEIELNGLPQDELTTYRTRVASVDGAETARVAAAHMPAPDAVAIVVVGKAAEIRAPLEAKYGPVQVVSPEACEDMSASAR